MKIVVTGGAGFIGANLCRELELRPNVDEIVALDNLSTGSAENLDGVDATLVEGSILDRALLDRSISLTEGREREEREADGTRDLVVVAVGELTGADRCRDDVRDQQGRRRRAGPRRAL